MDEHPTLVAIRELLATLPEATEKLTWGHPTFRAGSKMFAAAGERQGRVVVTVKASKADQALLLADAQRYYMPDYVGKHGWVGVEAERVALDTVLDLFEEAWRMQATKRALKAYDARSTSP